MAWFGESFANIKGQITSFTKEVLTVEDEDEVNVDTDSVKRLQEELRSLKEENQAQANEIANLRSKTSDLEEQLIISDRQNSTVKQYYEELIKVNEVENSQIKEQLVRLESAFKHLEEKGKAEVNSVKLTNVSQEASLLPVFTPRSAVSTDTEDIQTSDDLLIKELEERCSSYQNDLFFLRNELMTLQHEVDKAEERNAKFSDDISGILESEFRLDGQPILKSVQTQSEDSNTLILSKIKEISFIWKALVEKKATLERTVTKLSVSSSSKAASDESTAVALSDQLPHSSNSNIIDLFNEPFFPPKIDSFGLETILEEDRSEDEPHRPDSSEYIDEDVGSTVQSRRKETSSPTTTVSSTQTEDDELEEPTRDKDLTVSLSGSHATELALLQARADKWNQDEKDLTSKLADREEYIRRLELDLGRLRSHLVDLEDQTTNEALLNEKKQEQLQSQLSQLKNELSRTLQQKERSLDVREEMSRIAQERNSYRVANLSLEDQIQKLNAQLQNLHFVLEQFQREKEVEVRNVEKRLRLEMSQLEQKNELLRRDQEKQEVLLERAKSGLDAAHQLNAQIEEKTRAILHLKTQVQQKENEICDLKSKMDEVANNLDGKIDRYLIKNLIVGYFSTPEDKRNEVLRILATVLDFNREDRQKTGLESGFSLWQFGRRSSTAQTLETGKQTLSEAFIHFLENESKPKVEMRMSVDEVTRRNSQSTGGSPSMVMNSNVVGRESPLGGGSVGEGNPVSRNLAEISVSLPVLSQADRSNSILKDVLNPKP